ncbi:MAG: potassium-transporting ATPase subunit KdpA [Rhodospirillales bacterium]
MGCPKCSMPGHRHRRITAAPWRAFPPTRPLLDFGLGFAMLAGRFAFMIPVLAIAGSLAANRSCRLAPARPHHRPLSV